MTEKEKKKNNKKQFCLVRMNKEKAMFLKTAADMFLKTAADMKDIGQWLGYTRN